MERYFEKIGCGLCLISTIGIAAFVFVAFLQAYCDLYMPKALFIPNSILCAFDKKVEELHKYDLSFKDISGDWRYYEGRTICISPLSMPEYNIDSLCFFRAKDSREFMKYRYSSTYRFHISENGSANGYNFYWLYYTALSKAFDMSNSFYFMPTGSFRLGPTQSLRHLTSYIDFTEFHQKNKGHLFVDFYCDGSTIYLGQFTWSYPKVVMIFLDKNQSYAEKDNLVLYEELDSVKAQEVTVLSLAGLDLQNIPQKLKNFPQIKKLFMPFNRVKFTDADFAVLESLPNLEVLDIRGNDIANSPDPNLSRLKNLKSLKKLYMAGGKVLREGELPSGIYEAQSLETLSVGQFGDAKLEISEDLLKLKSLKALRFYYARLKNLPPQTLRKYTWYYNCDFDSTIPRADLPQFENKDFPEILMHAE